jgi:hypothetical protein
MRRGDGGCWHGTVSFPSEHFCVVCKVAVVLIMLGDKATTKEDVTAAKHSAMRSMLSPEHRDSG